MSFHSNSARAFTRAYAITVARRPGALEYDVWPSRAAHFGSCPSSLPAVGSIVGQWASRMGRRELPGANIPSSMRCANGATVALSAKKGSCGNGAFAYGDGEMPTVRADPSRHRRLVKEVC